MILPRDFYYEIQHPMIGCKAHLVVRPMTARHPAHGCLPAGAAIGDWAIVSNLHVPRAKRSMGCGTYLLGRLREWQWGTRTNIVLVASPYKGNGAPAERLYSFYARNGFTRISDTSIFYREVQ